MVRYGWLLAVLGCGRIHFAPVDDAAGDGAPDGPPFTGQSATYIKESNTGMADYFGGAFAISADGNTLALAGFGEDGGSVGINGNETMKTADLSGAVYVFVRSGSSWVKQAYLKASDTATGDLFGAAVALTPDGNTMVVTSPFRNGATNDEGAAYVFRRSGSIWKQEAAIVVATNPDSDDVFGSSAVLSADGSTLAIGALQEDSGNPTDPTDNSATDAGAIYVYRFAGTWTPEAYLKVPTPGANDRVGIFSDIAISATGDRLAVGDSGDDTAGTDAGGVYVFERAGSTWSLGAHVTATNAAAGDLLGFGVGLDDSGTILVAGAPHSDAGGVDSGAGYVFTRVGGTWTQDAMLVASNPGNGDELGDYVTISAHGNVIAFGAPLEDSGIPTDGTDNSALDSGAAYVFARTSAGWNQLAYVKATNPGADDQFGHCLALSRTGSTLVVGAPDEDGGGSSVGATMDDAMMDAGAVYVFE